MHGTRIKMKDGREYYSSIWEWRPAEGYFTVIDDQDENGGAPIELRFDDIESVFEIGQRTGVLSPGVPKIEDVDLLVRAREEGWIPCTTVC